MQFKGTVHRYGRDIDTDVIIPARYLNTSDPAELAKHCMEDLDVEFVNNVQPGDIIVADENFGCGSSREHAPIAIKAAGVDVVSNGDVVSVDADTGVITDETTGQTFTAQPFPEFLTEIINAGGLVARWQQKLGKDA